MINWEQIKEEIIMATYKARDFLVTKHFALLPMRAECEKLIWFKSYFKISYLYPSDRPNGFFLIEKILTFEQMQDLEFTLALRRIELERGEKLKREINPQELQSAEMHDFFFIKENLREKIFGQDEVLEEIVKKVFRKSFSLSSDEKKPLSFFWAGPTGVGKTETALELSRNLNYPFIRLDMSEYMQTQNVARLIGAPPGYIGYSQPGVLTPYSARPVIILVDEIEKAHPDIYHIFLQMLDYGTLTDGRNQKLDFSNAILIMTSNVGARELTARRPGFQETEKQIFESREERVATVKAAMEKEFSPEFLNRLSSVQVFNSLSPEVINKIVDSKIKDILAAIKNQYGVSVKLKKETKEKIYSESFDVFFGARPVGRALERHLLEPACEKILIEKVKDNIEL